MKTSPATPAQQPSRLLPVSIIIAVGGGLLLPSAATAEVGIGLFLLGNLLPIALTATAPEPPP